MRGTVYARSVKEAVLALGERGATYSEIQKKYPIPKGTLSYWFHAVGKSPARDTKRMHEYLAKAREKAVETIRNKKEERIRAAEREALQTISSLNLLKPSFQKALASMLYWAEGAKSDKGLTIFANTDPLLISLYIKLLRNSFPLDETKFRVRLHLHHYHDKNTALEFWSNLTMVPKSQFGRIHVKKRSTRKKFRENFRGICFVIYNDVQIRRQLMSLGRLTAERL